MIILEENFKWHLEAFASELFRHVIIMYRLRLQENSMHYLIIIDDFVFHYLAWLKRHENL